MGWNNSVFELLIVSAGGGPFTGLFVYSPAPGNGNLIASITASNGTDPFGNGFDAGIVSYSGLNTAILNASSLSLFAGITERATLSTSHFTVFNSSGATIYDIDLTRTAQFLYADTGSAVQGALVVSQAQNGGTDQFGNAYVAGETDYFNAGGVFGIVATQLWSGAIAWQKAATAAGPYSALSTMQVSQSFASPILSVAMFSPITGLALQGGNLEAIVGGAIETWHVVGAGGQPPFLNSFSAGGTAPRFQFEPIGGGRVRLSGAVNTGVVTGANTAMFTLPAGYRPARNLNFVTQNNLAAYTLGSSSVQVTTAGDVQLVPAGAAGKFVVLDGICFELD